MADEKRPRFPIWAFVLSGLLVAIPLSVFLLHLYIKALEERRWAEMRSYCEQVAREVRARDSKRPVLRGEPVSGNAWDDYRQGLASLPSWKLLQPVTDFVEQRPNADRATVQSLVELHAAIFQALRRGASRSHSDRKTDWETQSTLDSKPSNLAMLAAGRARLLTEGGRAREAMELLLDTAQFGQDCARNGSLLDSLIGVAALSLAQDELKRMLSAKALTREDCQELARELELLDRSFPNEADAYAVDSMSSGFNYLRLGNLRAILDSVGMSDPIAPTWRYGFSERLVIVDAWERACDWNREAQEAAGRPWNQADRVTLNQLVIRSGLKNPLIEKYYKIEQTLRNLPPSPPRNAFRERLAQLRLLRVVAAFRSSGELPVFEDPYGNKIQSSMTDTKLKLWSVGSDGVDDGGSGEWEARKGKDIVLEVER